jgi:hypothetical protein
MYGWFSEKDAKEKRIIYRYIDNNNNICRVTKITDDNICPYIEESVFGCDTISVGEVKEYLETQIIQIKYVNYNKIYDYITVKEN